MPRCARIMRNCAWDKLPTCWRCSTTQPGDCSLAVEPAISPTPDGNLAISSTKLCMPWQAKKDFRECNSPDPPGYDSCRKGQSKLVYGYDEYSICYCSIHPK